MVNNMYYLLIDTETSITGKVVDFAAIVCNKHGKIYAQCAVLIESVFDKEDLFFNADSGIFGRRNLVKRMDGYHKMLENGVRSIKTVRAVNVWLGKVFEAYSPCLTAYNLKFDTGACARTGIDLNQKKTMCLWLACCNAFADRKGYIRFCLENRLTTPALNVSTSAETMYKYLHDKNYVEPHTALEDLTTCELSILVYLLRQKKKINQNGYNWRNHRLVDKVRVL